MPLRPGTRVGAYEIGPLLGEGGMGEVYDWGAIHGGAAGPTSNQDGADVIGGRYACDVVATGRRIIAKMPASGDATPPIAVTHWTALLAR